MWFSTSSFFGTMSGDERPIIGFEVQWPWSRALVDGIKTLETRECEVPEEYRDITLCLIESAPTGPDPDLALSSMIMADDVDDEKWKEEWLRLKPEPGSSMRIIGTVTFGGGVSDINYQVGAKP